MSLRSVPSNLSPLQPAGYFGCTVCHDPPSRSSFEIPDLQHKAASVWARLHICVLWTCGSHISCNIPPTDTFSMISLNVLLFGIWEHGNSNGILLGGLCIRELNKLINYNSLWGLYLGIQGLQLGITKRARQNNPMHGSGEWLLSPQHPWGSSVDSKSF